MPHMTDLRKLKAALFSLFRKSTPQGREITRSDTDFLEARRQAHAAAFELIRQIAQANRPLTPHDCQSAIQALVEILED